MTLSHFKLLTQQQKSDSSATETTQPFHEELLDYSSWESQINTEANYWILITVPLLLIVAFLFEIRKKPIPLKKAKSLQSSDIPCYQCQYFDQNPYIKCAVHPTTALTKEACDCKEFESKQQPFE